jgi:3-oxoacyl-[acyl-carrier protein] reductase
VLLEGENAVVCGAGGAIGGAVARAFAREGATVFLAGRTLRALDAVAKEITDAGRERGGSGRRPRRARMLSSISGPVAEKAGGIDVSVNPIGIAHVQGTFLLELSLEDVVLPITTYTTAQFVTARAAARRMRRRVAGDPDALQSGGPSRRPTNRRLRNRVGGG